MPPEPKLSASSSKLYRYDEKMGMGGAGDRFSGGLVLIPYAEGGKWEDRGENGSDPIRPGRGNGICPGQARFLHDGLTPGAWRRG
ncbi:hypothetical protein D3C81_2131150 [compost metagenome]